GMVPLLCRAVDWPAAAARRPGGVRLADDEPGVFSRRHRVALAPPEILAAAPREAARMRKEALNPPPLRLIGRRLRRSHNPWMHNVARLRPSGDECRLAMHPLDAQARGLADGARVRLSSPSGALEVPIEIDDDLMPGTVSLPHGWGHSPDAGWQLAARAGET